MAQLAKPSPLRQWPQSGKLLVANLDLSLDSSLSPTLLDRQVSLVAEPSQAHLDVLAFNRQIPLVDFLNPAIREPIGSTWDEELPLDLKSQGSSVGNGWGDRVTTV